MKNNHNIQMILHLLVKILKWLQIYIILIKIESYHMLHHLNQAQINQICIDHKLCQIKKFINFHYQKQVLLIWMTMN